MIYGQNRQPKKVVVNRHFQASWALQPTACLFCMVMFSVTFSRGIALHHLSKRLVISHYCVVSHLSTATCSSPSWPTGQWSPNFSLMSHVQNRRRFSMTSAMSRMIGDSCWPQVVTSEMDSWYTEDRWRPIWKFFASCVSVRLRYVIKENIVVVWLSWLRFS